MAALGLYSSLGFIREKRLYHFYMNGKDAFRLVLPVIPYGDSESLSDATLKNISSEPIAVPQPVHIKLTAPAVATLETPPSPMYPIHGRQLSDASSTGSGPSPSPAGILGLDAPNGNFAIGGLLAAASPRSIESNDSFALYGAHIPSSISPPMTFRPVPAPRQRQYDDDDDYISSR